MEAGRLSPSADRTQTTHDDGAAREVRSAPTTWGARTVQWLKNAVVRSYRDVASAVPLRLGELRNKAQSALSAIRLTAGEARASVHRFRQEMRLGASRNLQDLNADFAARQAAELDTAPKDAEIASSSGPHADGLRDDSSFDTLNAQVQKKIQDGGAVKRFYFRNKVQELNLHASGDASRQEQVAHSKAMLAARRLETLKSESLENGFSDFHSLKLVSDELDAIHQVGGEDLSGEVASFKAEVMGSLLSSMQSRQPSAREWRTWTGEIAELAEASKKTYPSAAGEFEMIASRIRTHPAAIEGQVASPVDRGGEIANGVRQDLLLFASGNDAAKQREKLLYDLRRSELPFTRVMDICRGALSDPSLQVEARERLESLAAELSARGARADP
ncbi:hypothetical protein JI739_21575 [Ramlibacter sp. AW1]|uniref:Uncharacterized protein n=1 Tax=Ramlibacter aurantiacus TaxID=2801330 RepID=A0A936ZSL6_9BURK|nr:hypothetical protein [Ramlibacter aurantiacus]MBL0422941.1 hypothetical protein [Ramlibacter aurantiacus]